MYPDKGPSSDHILQDVIIDSCKINQFQPYPPNHGWVCIALSVHQGERCRFNQTFINNGGKIHQVFAASMHSLHFCLRNKVGEQEPKIEVVEGVEEKPVNRTITEACRTRKYI